MLIDAPSMVRVSDQLLPGSLTSDHWYRRECIAKCDDAEVSEKVGSQEQNARGEYRSARVNASCARMFLTPTVKKCFPDADFCNTRLQDALDSARSWKPDASVGADLRRNRRNGKETR
jgi:hypothetical protein